MSWVHFVEDQDLYRKCVMEGFPYARTLCGRMETRKSLSVLVDGVSCPACLLVMRMNEREMARGKSMEDDIERDLDRDLDDAGPSDQMEEEIQQEESPLGILDALVPDSFSPDESWERWLLSPSEDPEGSLGGEWDLRLRLRPDDLDLIVQVANLANMFGASRLAARLVDVIDNLSSRISSSPGFPPMTRELPASGQEAQEEILAQTENDLVAPRE